MQCASFRLQYQQVTLLKVEVFHQSTYYSDTVQYESTDIIMDISCGDAPSSDLLECLTRLFPIHHFWFQSVDALCQQ